MSGKKKINKLVRPFWALGFLLLPFFSGCQKDDICPAGSETTPLLVIEFYDAEEPDQLEAVQNLVVQAVGKEEALGPVTNNTISIPLRTDANVTEYRFIRNFGGENENTDIVRFTYNPATEYLNRACGFKVNYRDLNVNRQQDENVWILSDVVIQPNVENEAEAHISFTH